MRDLTRISSGEEADHSEIGSPHSPPSRRRASLSPAPPRNRSPGSFSDSGVGCNNSDSEQNSDSCKEISNKKDVGIQNEGQAEPQEDEAHVEDGGHRHAGAGLPIVGAILGLCVGGPVGIIAGAKLGGVAAIGGSLIGYTGASIIREQRAMRQLLTAQSSSQSSHNPRRTQSLHTVEGAGPAVGRRQKKAIKDDNENSEAENGQGDQKQRRRPTRRRKQVKVVDTKEKETEDVDHSNVIYPPHLHRRQWRRMTDMSHQDSFVALINNVHESELLAVNMNTVVVTALVCQENETEETADTRDTVITVTCPGDSLLTCSDDTDKCNDVSRAHFTSISAGNRRMRTSSLPDILEEDLVSNIS